MTKQAKAMNLHLVTGETTANNPCKAPSMPFIEDSGAPSVVILTSLCTAWHDIETKTARIAAKLRSLKR